MRLPLKHKIIGSQIGLILLTTVLLGGSCYFIMLYFLSNHQKADLEFIAATKSDALQQEILKISAQLKSIANSKAVEVYSTKFQDLALAEYLANFSELFPVLSYVNAEGAEEVKIVNGDISNQLIDRAEDALLRRAMKVPNTVFLSPVELSSDTGSPALRLAIARRAYFGDRFVGLIAATVPLARITNVVIDQKIGKTGFCSVIDSDGTILAFPDPQKVSTRIYNGGKANENFIPRENLFNPGYNQGYIFDRECLVAASPIEVDGRDWSVLAVLPYKEFRSALNLLRNSIVIVFIVVLLMGILISLRLAGGILKPIRNLRAAAVKMGEGRFDISLETQSKDEIGVLAHTFNEMASNLREKTVSLQEAQKRLHDQNFMLEEMVNERTAELMESNKKLQHEIEERQRAVEARQKAEAQYMEARKMEAIATLAGGIAHQFNNALSIINGYIELMQLESSQRGNIEQIVPPMQASVQRMTRLTDQLLAYARGGRYHAEPVSVSNLVNDTLLLIKRSLNPSTAIELDLPGDLLNVDADLAQLQMVMHAILSNAAEAMEEAGRIRVIGRNEIIEEHHAKELSDLKPGQYVSITVQDNGSGMSEDTKRRIFEPFFTTKFDGRGLGMAAVYGIIKNHNGWISVDSQLDQGTRVRIILPASKPKEENPD